MFDTVALSKSLLGIPATDFLLDRGAVPGYSPHTSELNKWKVNSNLGSKEPRITFSKRSNKWTLRAEVSIGEWLYDSNLHLPDEADLKVFFEWLSIYIETKTGIKFDTGSERVVKAHITRDFYLTEDKVLSALSKIREIRISRYITHPFGETTVYFDSKGKKKNKRITLYSKLHQLESINASTSEIEKAKRILRLEIEHEYKAVYNLSKSLNYPYHSAEYILTKKTSDKVIEDTIGLLNLDKLLEDDECDLKKLALRYDTTKCQTLIGHLVFKKQYGADYWKLPFITLTKATIKKYDRECAKTGITSL